MKKADKEGSAVVVPEAADMTSKEKRRRDLNLLMIEAKAKWRAEAREVAGSTTASLYATLLVVIYVAFSFTELVRFPHNKDYLEIYGFFTFLYFTATLYLIYILTYVVKHEEGSPRAVDNFKSHGSVTVRLGVVIFGIGALIYYLMELLRFAELAGGGQSPCFHPSIGVNDCLALVFTTLQAYSIFTYPRLNIHSHKLLNRFGTMHLVALNIIMWIRTLIKESIEEIIEFEKDSEGHHGRGGFTQDGTSCRSLLVLMEEAESQKEVCNEYRHDILGDAAVAAVPYLYPFMIEYALIGASVALIMSKHIGKPKLEVDLYHKPLRRPNPRKFWVKSDFSHSTKGVILGTLVFIAAIVNLSTFFGLDGHEHSKDEAELLSKISNSVMNTIGVIACLVGIERIQQLDHKHKSPSDEEGFDLDETLLRFGSVFTFLYSTFVIITGSFNGHIEGFPNEVFILNGILEIMQAILQVIFIHNLKEKVLPESLRDEKPGRQVTAFLFLFNVSQWLVYTFEIQKVRASLVEAEFYGFMPWVIIRRVTLPLAVFFRFHSSVVSIELWKEVYCVEDEDDQHVVMSSSELSSDDAVTQANTKLAELAPSTDHADKYILAKSLENHDEHIEMD